MEPSKRLSPARILAGLSLAIAILTAGPLSARAETNPRLSLPRSVLDEPFADRIHLVGFGAMGFADYVETGQPGFGAAFIIRPGTSRRFVEQFADWNVSLVLQAERQEAGDDRRILSADAIVRRYAHPFGEEPGRSFFYGVGVGACNATRPTGGTDSGVDVVIEAGQEWNRASRLSVFFWQFQCRYLRYHEREYAHCSIKAGCGVPLPW